MKNINNGAKSVKSIINSLGNYTSEQVMLESMESNRTPSGIYSVSIAGDRKLCYYNSKGNWVVYNTVNRESGSWEPITTDNAADAKAGMSNPDTMLDFIGASVQSHLAALGVESTVNAFGYVYKAADYGHLVIHLLDSMRHLVVVIRNYSGNEPIYDPTLIISTVEGPKDSARIAMHFDPLLRSHNTAALAGTRIANELGLDAVIQLGGYFLPSEPILAERRSERINNSTEQAVKREATRLTF